MTRTGGKSKNRLRGDSAGSKKKRGHQFPDRPARMLEGLAASRRRLDRRPEEVAFEAFRDTVARTYASALKTLLPPAQARKKLWQSTARVAWIGLVHEQESFYLTLSFGLLKGSKPPSPGSGSPSFDCDEVRRLNQEQFGDVDTDALRDAFDDLLDPGLPVERAGIDEEDFESARDDLRRLAALTALGLFALELRRNPGAYVPDPFGSDFEVTVSGDVESPFWGEPVPGVAATEAARQKAVEALCATDASKRLFHSLLAAGDEDRPPDLVAMLARTAPA